MAGWHRKQPEIRNRPLPCFLPELGHLDEAVESDYLCRNFIPASSDRDRSAELNEIGVRKFGDHRDPVTGICRWFDTLDDCGRL
jgi:hypothetical protein